MASENRPEVDRAAVRRRISSLFRAAPFIAVLSPMAILALWEVAAALSVIDARFLPPPSQLAAEFAEVMGSGQLLRDTGWSLLRLLFGFGLGAAGGVLVGAAIALSGTLRALVAPVFAAMYAVPKTALLPVLVLIFGFSETTKVLLLSVSAFFLVQVNTTHGVLTIPRVLFEVAKDTGASRWQVIRTVAVPGALPYIMAGLNMAWTVGLIVLVFVEMQATENGLGAFIMASWRLFEVDRMMVGLLTLAVVGLVSNALFDTVTRWLLPWKK